MMLYSQKGRYLIDQLPKFLVVQLLLILLFAGNLSAQSIVRSGTVTDEAKGPLPGVSIQIKGTKTGTSTDANGKFALDAPADAILVISYIGFENQEIAVNNRKDIPVVLKASVADLNEVVVVGYGTQKKSDLTGSISSIDAKQLDRVPTSTRIDQTLQGLAPGVSVAQTDAQPGGNVKIEIRGGNSILGSNAPIFVIDGFVGPGNLSAINPADIESIQILKDASATAIYGARGANGVVLVTTKQGKTGKAVINVSSSYGTQQVRNKLEMLNATQFAELVNEQRANDGQAPLFADPASLGQGTDWQNEIFRTAPMQDHTISFSGGTEATKYFVSGNFSSQDGIVINSAFQRGSFRANLNSDLSDKFKIGTNFTASYQSRDGVAVNTDPQAATPGVINSALRYSPTVPVYDANGDYALDQEFSPGLVNPVSLAKEQTRDNLTSRMLGTFFGEYKFIEGLTLKVTVGGNISTTKGSFYDPRTTVTGAAVGGNASIDNNLDVNWMNDNILTYEKKINADHSFSIMGGFTQQAFKAETSSLSSQDFVTDGMEYNNIGLGGNFLRPQSGYNDWALKSFLTRVTYNYKDKYLFTGTARADGSSKFGADHKWGYFPSASAKWRVSKEKFFENIDVVNDLSLRGSYGVTGNESLASYSSLASLNSGQNAVFGDIVYVGVGPGRLENPDLKWESTAQMDIGLDFALLSNRITSTIDYYEKKTSDLLFAKAVPSQIGLKTAISNIGSISNKGWEFSVTSYNFVNDFKWSTTANLYLNRSKVLNLAESNEQFYGGSSYLAEGQFYSLKVGEPIGSFYGYVDNGIFQNAEEIASSAQPAAKPGDMRYVDLDGDNKITATDRQIIGVAQPKFSYGLNNDFSYKGFDLNVFINGVYGNQLLNLNRADLIDVSGQRNNSIDALDRWTPTNPSNDVTRATKARNTRISSRYIEDGSYLRVKNLLLGYNLPASVTKKLKLQNLRVFVSGQNLFTITNYKGYDPEVNSQGENNIQIGTDFGSYPTARIYTMGINLSL